MKAKNLVEISKKLDLSVKVLKGIQKGDKRNGGDITRTNMARCLGTISKFTGYSSQQHAAKEIDKNIRMLYISSEQLAKNLRKFANKISKKRKPMFYEALKHLQAGRLKSYNKTMYKIGLNKLTHTIHTKIDEALIDKYRESPKQDTAAAKKLRGDKRILIKSDAAIVKAVNKRAKRWGVTASLFWEAATKFNPNPNVKGIVGGKKKLRQKTKGTTVKTAHKPSGVMTAKITHHLERKKGKFRTKLNKKIKEQQKFWGKQINKEIMAYMALDKLLGK